MCIRDSANIADTQYTDDSKVTDHYAIIPTGQLTELSGLTSLQRAVFELKMCIRDRSRAGRRLPALVRIMRLISEIVINQNSKYAE